MPLEGNQQRASGTASASEDQEVSPETCPERQVLMWPCETSACKAGDIRE